MEKKKQKKNLTALETYRSNLFEKKVQAYIGTHGHENYLLLAKVALFMDGEAAAGSTGAEFIGEASCGEPSSTAAKEADGLSATIVGTGSFSLRAEDAETEPTEGAF